MNVPALRFKGFEGAWETSALGKKIEWIKTNNLSREFLTNSQTHIQNIHYGDIHSKYKSHFKQSEENIPYVGTNSPAQQFTDEEFCRKGDVVIADASEDLKDIGKAIEIIEVKPRSLVAGLHTFIARPIKESFVLGFLGVLLQSASVRKQVQKLAQGISVLGISKANLSHLRVVTPTLPEQQKIADFLSAVDEKLNNLRAQHAALSQYKTGLMQQLFSQQLRFTQDDGTAFPDWEEKALGDVATKRAEKNRDGGVVRVLTNSAVQGVIDQGDYFERDIANADNLDGYCVVEEGDFVYNPRISVTAPVGPIKRNNVGLGVMSPLYTVFRFNNANTDFYLGYFETNLWHEYMKSVANYGARFDRMAISTSNFLSLPLPCPCTAEQQKIAAALSSLDDQLNTLAKRIAHTQAFKQGLLQQLFV